MNGSFWGLNEMYIRVIQIVIEKKSSQKAFSSSLPVFLYHLGSCVPKIRLKEAILGVAMFYKMN